MQFVLSSLLAPDVSLPDLLTRAKSLGFDGVELHGSVGDPDAVLAAGRAQPDVKILCVSAPVCYHGDKNEDVVTAGVVESAIDLAALVHCPLVRIDDALPHSGRSAATLTDRYGRFLRPLGDYALDRNVTLLVENGPTFRTSRDLWNLLDRLQHPGLAASWNTLASVAAGESVLVSVPTLNARIRHVRLADAKLVGCTLTPAPLGEGIVPVPALLKRLKGIGYRGPVALVGAASADVAEPLKRVKDWTKPPEVAKPKPAPVPRPAGAAAKAVTGAAAPRPVPAAAGKPA